MTKNLKLTITQAHTTVNFLLENKRFIEYDNSKIYLVDNKTFKDIYDIYLNTIDIFENSKAKRKAKDPFFQIAKIIIPDKQFIAYKPFKKHKYKNITDPIKVKEKIIKSHAIALEKTDSFANQQILKYKDKLNDELRAKIKQEAIDKKNYINKMKNFLLENYDLLDIRITSFKDKKIYPAIRLIDTTGESYTDYIRVEVPNIINAHENIFLLDDEYRKDAKHIKFVLSAKHAFEQIFYTYKEEKNEEE